MDDQVTSPARDERSSTQRRSWVTPVLHEIVIDEGTDGKTFVPMEIMGVNDGPS
jgi:hypothetical protein